MSLVIKRKAGRVNIDPALPPAVVDCAAKMPFCQGACCRLRFYLTIDEANAGIVRYDKDDPFRIEQGPLNYCVHRNASMEICGVFENRPSVCRAFDCRKDDRIWVDFDKNLVNPDIHLPSWPDTIK